jgi:hypothetical protein
MAKSKGKAVKAGDGGTAGSFDRTARIALGRQVLAAVQTRIDTYLMDSGRAGMGSGGKRVTEKTRKKYEDEEIENTAFDKGLEPKNLRVSVDLARLTDRLADPDAPDLAATVESGLLRLTVPLLAELLKLEDEELAERVRQLLAEQI